MRSRVPSESKNIKEPLENEEGHQDGNADSRAMARGGKVVVAIATCSGKQLIRLFDESLPVP